VGGARRGGGGGGGRGEGEEMLPLEPSEIINV